MKFLTPEEMKIKKDRQKKIMFALIFVIMVSLFTGITFLTYSL
ncbi:hypothetical protein ACQUWN_21585 [Rossellomorea aquimaris]|nr:MULTISPECIES: hypothetical protein [Bacillaceae]